jgi:short-subunit dehydrogenase
MYRHTVKRQKNLAARYNQGDSWAVVTGGSDGIGEQFCKDLANQGFNICVIARNEDKIKEKLKGIQASVKSGKQIKTRYVVADLAKATKYEEYERMAE